MEKRQKTWLTYSTHQLEENREMQEAPAWQEACRKPLGMEMRRCKRQGRGLQQSHKACPRNTLAVVGWPDEVEGLQRLWKMGDWLCYCFQNEWIAQALGCFMVCSSWTLLYFLSRRWLPWSRSDRREMCQLLHEPASPLQCLVCFFQACVQPPLFLWCLIHLPL